MKPDKKRLDQLMVVRNITASRERARALITDGSVLVNGLPASKPGTIVTTQSTITLKTEDFPYVSRGGLKMEKALQTFSVNLKDAVCLDIGASVLLTGSSCIESIEVPCSHRSNSTMVSR